MEAQGITLVECKPYGARITPKACALRKAKALELEKKGVVANAGHDAHRADWGKYVQIEKCVECPGHGAASAADLCRNGDGNPAKHDGLCQRCHYTAEAKRRRTEITANVKAAATCEDCGRSKEQAGRIYNKKCPDCRKKAKETPGPKGTPAAEPPAPPRERERESRDNDTIVDRLLDRFNTSLDEAREIRKVLKGIKDLTGADFELPEIRE